MEEKEIFNQVLHWTKNCDKNDKYYNIVFTLLETFELMFLQEFDVTKDDLLLKDFDKINKRLILFFCFNFFWCCLFYRRDLNEMLIDVGDVKIKNKQVIILFNGEKVLIDEKKLHGDRKIIFDIFYENNLLKKVNVWS